MNKGKVAILGAKRTPLGVFGGVFKNYSAVKLGTDVLSALCKEINFSPHEIQKVFFGNVISAGLGQNAARQIAYESGLKCPAVSVNKVCGSGMEAIILAVQAILSGNADLVIAGGTENMSQAPYLLEKARFGQKMGNGVLIDAMEKDGLTDAFSGKIMLQVAGGKVLDCFAPFVKNNDTNFLREIQDEWAHLSYQRALKAQKEGKFLNEIVKIILDGDMPVENDEGPSKYKPEKLDKLNPIIPGGVITAGNASQISDGAAALLLSSLGYVKKNNLKPLAIIDACDALAGNPDYFPILPTLLLERFFGKNNMKPDDIDLFEINEAFALVPIYAERKLGIPKEKINIHGGAIALGHPLGASGARIVVTLIHALKEYGKKKGIATICIGGGEALLLSVEIV